MMYLNIIGNFFKEKREEAGWSQGELAIEIGTDKQTISKIERGINKPRRETMIAFCQKFGIVGERYYDVNAFEELEVHEIKEQIRKASGNRDYTLAYELIDELVKEYKSKCETAAMKQFLIWVEAVNGKRVGDKFEQYSYWEKISLYIKALCCTKPQFNISELENMLLTIDEITIVMNIAWAYYQEGEVESAGMIYEKLLDYVEKHLMPISESYEIIPLLTYNYSLFLGHTGNQEKCIEVAEKGIENCRKFNKPGMLGELLINKACAMEKLSIGDKGLEVATESYYVLKAMKSSNSADKVLEYIRETHGCEPSYQPIGDSSKI